MASPAEVVASSFAQAQTYATSAQTALAGFTAALDAAVYSPPSVSVTWNSLAAPSLPSLPSQPSLPAIVFSAPTAPGDWAPADPTITIDNFTATEPTLNLPAIYAPVFGYAPTVASVGDVTMPTAPTLDVVATPDYLALSTPTFGGVDLHQDYLSKLDNIPTLNLVAPTPYNYTLGPEYASALLSTLKSRLMERLTGGSGLTPAVEQAIWDRARSRETVLAQANQDEVMRSSEAFGFHLPTGVLAAQLREAQQGYYDKLSGLSRDVAIKQADLEQENLKQTIAQGMDLEGRLIDYSYKLETMSFESAKTCAENAIQVHNALLDEFKSLLSAYQTYAQAYDTLIKGELAKVEVFKALLQGEQTKADINKSLVAQYVAEIEAGMSRVKIYEAEVGAAKTLVEVEQIKVAASGEQIKAYVAQINGETAKVEASKLAVEAETSKLTSYKIKADVFTAKTGAQAEKARLELGKLNAMAGIKSQQWDGYKAKVSAESERMRALGMQSSAQMDSYRVGAAAVEASAGMHTKIWETQIRQYEAGQNLVLQAGKINNDAIIATNNARLDAAKVGAQVYAQVTSSAYGMIHASAGVSGSTGVSYSYSGKVVGEVAPMT